MTSCSPPDKEAKPFHRHFHMFLIDAQSNFYNMPFISYHHINSISLTALIYKSQIYPVYITTYKTGSGNRKWQTYSRQMQTIKKKWRLIIFTSGKVHSGPKALATWSHRIHWHLKST